VSQDRIGRRWRALADLDDWRAKAHALIPPAGWPLALDDDGVPIPDPGPAEPTGVDPRPSEADD